MIKCLGYKSGNPIDGYDYSCEYEKADFGCEDCICTGGTMSPQTGKLFRGNIKKYQDIALKELKEKHEEKEFIPFEVKLNIEDLIKLRPTKKYRK